ncbi:MAG: hypothetical protein ACFHX7_15485 [Pseudomonadota bacterium]
MNHTRHEFCSDDWVKATRHYVTTAARGADLSGLKVSFNEVFTSAPSHLGANEDGLIGWFIRVEDGAIEVGKGILDQADLRITADYDTVVPLARTVFEGDAKAAAAAQQTIAAATADGRFRREGDESAMASLTFLAGLHDALATMTA